MKLFYSWKDSLSLLLPRNLTVLSLVTLKLCQTTVALFAYYFWWLIVVQLVCYGMVSVSDIDKTYPIFSPILITQFFQYIYIAIFFILARPCVERKDRAYILKYSKKLPLIMGLLWGSFLLIYIIRGWFLGVMARLWFAGLPYGSYQCVAISVLILLRIFFNMWTYASILFFLDSKSSLKKCIESIANGFKMLWYNFPLFILIGLIDVAFLLLPLTLDHYNGGFNALRLLMIKNNYLGFGLLGFALIKLFFFLIKMMIIVCTLTTLYVKRLYEQYELYIPKKS